MQFLNLVKEHLQSKHNIEIIVEFDKDNHQIVHGRSGNSIIMDKDLFTELHAFFAPNNVNIGGYYSQQPYLTEQGRLSLDEYAEWVNNFIYNRPIVTDDFDLNNVALTC